MLPARLARREPARLRLYDALQLLVAVQLCLIAAAAIGVALGLPLWAISDERAHVSFIAAIGAGHLPLLDHFPLQPDLARIGNRPAAFETQSYEAFQPPLYYVLMAIPWDLAKAVGGVTAAVHALRLLNVPLLAIDVGLLWALARRVAPSRETALGAFAFALTYLLWPGVVFRSVTVSNIALEMPLTTAALLAMWIAFNDGSSRALLAAGGLCGLGWLCRLPFPAVVLLPVVVWHHRHRSRAAAAAALALPVILVAPWLIDNLHRYHALTAAAVVREMQGSFSDPGNRPFGVDRLLHSSIPLLGGIIPEEWVATTAWFIHASHRISAGLIHVLRGALVVLVVLPGGVWLWRGPRRTWLLVAPLAIGLVLMWIETAAERVLLIEPRYVYPLLPAFALAGGLALTRLGHKDGELAAGGRRAAAVPLLSLALTGLLIALWLYLVIAIPPIQNT
jgi:hypothetical protein